MRILLLIAVLVVLADVFLYSGAYSRAAYRQVSWAANQFVALIGEIVDDVNPDRESAVPTRRI